MLRAKLYNYSGEVNKIIKSLGDYIYNVPFTFLDNYDLQNPHIVLTLSGNDADGTAMQAYRAFQINYILIDDSENLAFMSQCYFVDKIIWQTNELLEFVLRKDVLFTYSSYVSNLSGFLDRCEDSAYQDLYIKDGLFSFQKRFSVIQTELESIPFPSPISFAVATIQTVDGFPEANTSVGSPNLTGDLGEITLSRKGINGSICVSLISCSNVTDAATWLNSLASYVIENNAKASFILGAWVFPFYINVDGLMKYDTEHPNSFPIDNELVPIGPITAVARYFAAYMTSTANKMNNLYHDITTPTILPQYNDFRDYEPYTKLSLTIPFYGDYELNASLVYGNTIRLRYVFDFSSGSSYCIVMIIKSAQEAIVLDTLPCTALIPITLNSTTREQVNAQSDSNALNFLTKIISGAASGFMIGATGNVAGGAAIAAASVISGLSDFASREAVNIEKGVVGAKAYDSYISSFCSNLRCVVLKRFTSNISNGMNNLDAFAHLYGRPSSFYTDIGSLTLGSYLKFSEIHADIPYATSQEKEEIERLLMSGVYK